MYRLAWVISKGQIDHKAFLVSAQENHFFFHSLQLRSLLKPPSLTISQEIKGDDNFRYKLAYDSFVKLKQSLNMIKEIAKNLGVTEFLDNLVRLEDLMSNKGQEPIEFYNGLDLVDVFRHLWIVVIQIQIVYEEMNKKTLASPIDPTALPKATEGFLNSVQGLLLNRISTKFAVRKIQKIWKEKAKKAIAVTATVIKSIALFKRKLKKK